MLNNKSNQFENYNNVNEMVKTYHLIMLTKQIMNNQNIGN